MSTIERLKFDAVIEQRDTARKECERLTRQLDECRSEVSFLQNRLGERLQQLAQAKRQHEDAVRACDVLRDVNNGLRTELAMLRQERTAERAPCAVVKPEQPAETELEQKAWQAFLAATAAACNHLSPAGAFQEAKDWIIHRDFRRKNKIT